MANEFPSLEDEARAASATGTTQLLERAVLLLALRRSGYRRSS